MDYSDLMSSVINENENVGNAAMAAKQIIGGHDEAISGILTDVGTPVGTLLLAGAGLTKANWVGALKGALSKSGGPEAGEAAQFDGEAAQFDNPVFGAGRAAATEVSTATDSVDAVVDTAVSAAETTFTSSAASALSTVGATATEETVGATLSTGLDATGILAPLGVAVMLGTIVGSAVESFLGHHETDSAPVNLGNLTSLAFDPSST